MTGYQLIQRIEALCGLPAAEQTVDRLVDGDGEQVVRAVATSFISSIASLRQAVERGANFFITHEPTFYNHLDLLDGLADDPIVRAKRDLIAASGLMIYRFHDLAHRMRPDLIHQGVLECLGWPPVERRDGVRMVRIAPTPLAELAKQVRQRTGGHVVRFVGKPEHMCRCVGLCVGSPGIAAQLAALRHPEVDVMLIGETSEWAIGEYVRDANSAGRDIAMLLAGHRNSEEAGMAWIARWLSRELSIDVQHLSAGDPFQVA